MDSKTISRARILLVAAIILFFAGNATGQTKPDTMKVAEAQILQLEQDRIQAMIVGVMLLWLSATQCGNYQYKRGEYKELNQQ